MPSDNATWLPFDLGYTPGQMQFALWQPMLDRFLLTGSNLELMHDIKQVAAGRYDLWVCELTTATNYRANLIDNQCCQHWTLADTGNVTIGQTQPRPSYVPALRLRENLDLSDWEVDDELEFLQMARHWLDFVASLKATARHMLGDEIAFIRRISDHALQHSLWDGVYEFETKILRVLFFGQDNANIMVQCNDLLHDHRLDGMPQLYRRYRQSHA